jgi:two-component system CheB/CheR fusion protein
VSNPGPVETASIEHILQIVRSAARRLVAADGVALAVRHGDEVQYIEEEAVGPLWKGQRFPLSTCVSGWVMTHGTPAVIPDIYADPRVLQDAYRPTFVKSMAMVPIGNPPFAAIGAYWAGLHEATDQEIETLKAIADSAMIQVDSSRAEP